jgi:hypothetical protein
MVSAPPPGARGRRGSSGAARFARVRQWQSRLLDVLAQRDLPTALAVAVGGTPGDIIAGTEQWRHGPFGALLGDHLDEFARFACRLGAGTARADVVLERRKTLDAPAELIAASATCP